VRKLFLRFFFTYWLAFLAVGAATFIATQWLTDQRRAAEFARQEQLAEAARAALDSRGLTGLHDWLQDNVRREGPDNLLYIIDDRGEDLLGRRVPEYMRARLGRVRMQRPEPSDSAGRILAREVRIASLIGPAGGRYDLFFTSRLRLMDPFGPVREAQIIGAVLTLLVSAALSLLLARYFSRPVRVLRDATHAIASGNLDVRVAGLMRGRRDELGALAVEFDVMAVRLRTLLETRQTLLRDVSHELRSPLARLQIALGLARRPGADLVQEMDRIENEAQRLDELIGEILSLSRLDDPVRQLQREDVDLYELLDTLCESARLEGAPRNISVALSCPEVLQLQGDRELLYRAVENVLRNAVRFSPDGGQVSVRAVPEPRAVLVTIEDQGQGVPADALPHLFEPFYRVAAARDRDSGGHGIGLAIAARVIRLHNGSIAAANLPAGGLRVSMQLPLTAG
jgi:two-component system, OmpR family, sensor kinase